MACSAEQPPNITMVVQQQPEEKETDLRLAMEFPRHNWLVKHLLKEKMLKVRFFMGCNQLKYFLKTFKIYNF